MNAGTPMSGPRKLSDRAANYAREFLSALFMSLRTAQIHDPTNQAYQGALDPAPTGRRGAVCGQRWVRGSHRRRRILHQRHSTEHSTTEAAPRCKRCASNSKHRRSGGFTIESAPTGPGLAGAHLADGRSRQPPGLQAWKKSCASSTSACSDPSGSSKKPPPTSTAQPSPPTPTPSSSCRSETESCRSPGGPADPHSSGPSEIKAVRVVQDLVELFSERLDIMLRLATNDRGASKDETARRQHVFALDRARSLLGLSSARPGRHRGGRAIPSSRSSDHRYRQPSSRPAGQRRTQPNAG